MMMLRKMLRKMARLVMRRKMHWMRSKRRIIGKQPQLLQLQAWRLMVAKLW